MRDVLLFELAFRVAHVCWVRESGDVHPQEVDVGGAETSGARIEPERAVIEVRKAPNNVVQRLWVLEVVDSWSRRNTSAIPAEKTEASADEKEHEEEHSLLGSKDELRDRGEPIEQPLACLLWSTYDVVVERIDATTVAAKLEGYNLVNTKRQVPFRHVVRRENCSACG